MRRWVDRHVTREREGRDLRGSGVTSAVATKRNRRQNQGVAALLFFDRRHCRLSWRSSGRYPLFSLLLRLAEAGNGGCGAGAVAAAATAGVLGDLGRALLLLFSRSMPFLDAGAQD